jgi:hypothetical protein
MKQRYFLFLIALWGGYSHPISWSQRLSRTLYKIGRTISVGLPLGMGTYGSFLTAKTYNLMKEFEEMEPKVPQNIEEWCREQLRPCGEEFSRKVLIRENIFPMFATNSPATAGTSSIRLHSAVIEAMDPDTTTRSKPSEVETINNLLPPPLGSNLSSMPWIVRHEAGHLHFGDAQLSAMATSIGTSIALPQLAASGIRFLRKVKPPTTLGRSCAALGMGIIGAYTKMYSSLLLLLGFRRYQEARADAFASKHTASIKELEAAEQFFQNVEHYQLQQLKELEGFNRMPLEKQNFYSKLFHFVSDPCHPSPVKRAERIRTVIGKCKQQQA